jgi:hypothetical protein
MSLIRKSDVKNHLSTRTGDSTVPVQPLIHADPTGYSEDSSQEAVAVAVSMPAREAAAIVEKPKA